MKPMSRLFAAFAFALLISAPAALAQIPETSPLPVDEPLIVGDVTLQPGTYVIRLLPGEANRNQVQVTSPDLKTIYTTVLTVPHQLAPTEEVPNTTFVFYPPGETLPRALRTWYAPDPVSRVGHDIVYEESRAKLLAQAAKAPVVYYNAGSTDLKVITPDNTTQAYVYTPPPAPAPVVTETPVQVAESRPMQMPHTAGNTALFALLGLVAVGAAVGFRLTR